MLDALALAVIGGIGLKAGFHSIPKCPSVDARGIKMQIIGADLI
jgi:predicted RNase H-like nuclease